MQRLLIVLVALGGITLLLYPTAASWFSDRAHATEISGYGEMTAARDDGEIDSMIQEAKAFNAALPGGPIRDPYVLNANGRQTSIGPGSQEYKELLGMGDDGMIGRISIPAINAQLPIFHGTGDDTLAKGVGHLFGSALPVGGESTHSVMTAHSGYVNSTLFDDLKKVAIGDVFNITVLNQTIYYKVDQILTVLPDETDDLRKANGKDYVTLITCTPTGVNTHRLLVRGERIEAPGEESEQAQVMAANAVDPGFPWWALAIAGAGLGSVLVTRPRRPGRLRAPVA
ncbi:sortase A [Arthrobacter stackebrandtii]|uniref:Sortase A n=1 Tax=Arthrobacter stackebrandtii TaxID=272161 RepID=A0ABS4YWU0_9MICC|nr:class C sortase [Arthrobacter stackebrandtii]MBP2413252.1 sortase A [Arthrobacter stackebrandtii]